MSAKMFFLYPEQVKPLEKLCSDKVDGAYIVLSKTGDKGEFSHIAQYSGYYNNIKLITVKTEDLDKKLKVGY